MTKIALICIMFTNLLFANLIGTKAKDFTLVNEEGRKVSLSFFNNKIVILEWLNHGCPFIKKHYDSNNMQKIQKEVIGKNTVWLSIISSVDGKQGYVDFKKAKEEKLAKNSNATNILLDPKGEVGQMYGAKTTPHMFIIDTKGIIQYEGAIDSIASADPADIDKATNYVSNAIKALKSDTKVFPQKTKPYGCSVKY